MGNCYRVKKFWTTSLVALFMSTLDGVVMSLTVCVLDMFHFKIERHAKCRHELLNKMLSL